MFSKLLGLSDTEVNSINLSFKDRSNDALSRMIPTYTKRFSPDLIICNLTALSRNEIIYPEIIVIIGDWFLNNPYTKLERRYLNYI